jgi:aminoglycoside phosphotransferase
MGELLAAAGAADVGPDGLLPEALPSSRGVYRFTLADGEAVVGKFFGAYPPRSPLDWGLAHEYANYLRVAALGVDNGRGLIPRLLGRRPEVGLGLLLKAAPGPDLDHLLAAACQHGDMAPLLAALEQLAGLLAAFHSRPLPLRAAPPGPALTYFAKVLNQLDGLGLLTHGDRQALAAQLPGWEARLAQLPDRQVLVHGDATPTNFLFPDGRAVAVDLERLRAGDRLWDLSWVAGELKHAWGWRTGNLDAAEPAIGHFFRAYLAALAPEEAMARRLFALNPLYMAMVELRIARNSYLVWDYRRELVAEARRCLAAGRE